MGSLNNVFLVVAIFFFLTVNTTERAKADSLTGTSYYVWDFSSPNNGLKSTLACFTGDFEEALINSRQGTALERRSYAKLFNQIENEKQIQGLDSIPSPALKDLKALEADFVVFGEVIDDKEGGKIKITVSFQRFNSEIFKKNSVYLDRGKRFDPESRKNIMEELVNNIFPSSDETKISNNLRYSKNFIYENDFLFVNVVNITKIEEQNKVSLSLKIVNTTNNDIFLAIDTDSNYPSIAGDHGVILKPYQLSAGIYGLPVQRHSYSNEEKSKYSRIFAGKSTTINIIFYSKNNIKSNIFTFTSEMIRFNEGKPIKFSVGISNITL